MTSNDATHVTTARENLRRVLFIGTASSTLLKGTAVFYDRNYGTAASYAGLRDRRVRVGSQTNNNWFAGVTAETYTINSVGSQLIHIVEPRSVCLVAISDTVTIGGYLTASITSNRFGPAGFFGRGTCRALQTVAAVADTTSTGPISSSVDGSATYATATKTLTKTSAFTYAAVGDIVQIIGGATTATMVAAVTPGRYTIASVTSANAVVLSTSASAVDASVSFYLMRGNPTVEVELLDGTESGCTEWITPLSTAVTPSMVGGFTFIFGGATITTDATYALAVGTVQGEYKGWRLMGALTTNDYLVTPTTTTALQVDGTTTLASLEFDGADDSTILQWLGTKWRVINNIGTAQA